MRGKGIKGYRRLKKIARYGIKNNDYGNLSFVRHLSDEFSTYKKEHPWISAPILPLESEVRVYFSQERISKADNLYCNPKQSNPFIYYIVHSSDFADYYNYLELGGSFLIGVPLVELVCELSHKFEGHKIHQGININANTVLYYFKEHLKHKLSIKGKPTNPLDKDFRESLGCAYTDTEYMLGLNRIIISYLRLSGSKRGGRKIALTYIENEYKNGRKNN